MSGSDTATRTQAGDMLGRRDDEPDRLLTGLGPAKIGPRHLERLAIVYVRQSSAHQVVQHRESKARQYLLG